MHRAKSRMQAINVGVQIQQIRISLFRNCLSGPFPPGKLLPHVVLVIKLRKVQKGRGHSI